MEKYMETHPSNLLLASEHFSNLHKIKRNVL